MCKGAPHADSEHCDWHLASSKYACIRVVMLDTVRWKLVVVARDCKHHPRILFLYCSSKTLPSKFKRKSGLQFTTLTAAGTSTTTNSPNCSRSWFPLLSQARTQAKLPAYNTLKVLAGPLPGHGFQHGQAIRSCADTGGGA